MTNKLVVLVTCRSGAQARRIARALIDQRLAACANILENPVISIYRWKQRVESARESLVIIKTTRRRFRPLRRAVERLHSYEVPEIIALPILEGSRGYLDWISESVRASAGKRRRRIPQQE
jgi:periplasmic divalent cation tolerance protein